jgi:hypothetical protein
MIDRGRRLGFAAIAGLSCVIPVSAATAEAGRGTAATIEQLVRDRLDAYTRRDGAAWSKFVDENCVCGGSNRAGLLAELAARPAALKNGYGEVHDFRLREIGDTAIAFYRVTEYSQVGEQRIEIEQWRTETFLRRGGTWVLVAGAAVPLPHDPPVAEVEPGRYDAFVGSYEYDPGMIDTISREGDRLYVQAGAMEREELVPESASSFFAKGQDWRVIFVLDSAARVTALRFRQHGQDFVARRLP